METERGNPAKEIEMQETTVRDGRTIKVGDYVEFKSDVEQVGRVVEIVAPNSGRGGYNLDVMLVVEDPDGFDGEYIGGDTRTTLRAEDCF